MLAPICTCQVQPCPCLQHGQGQLEAGNNTAGETSDSEPEPAAGLSDIEPEEDLHAPESVPMNQAGHMFYSVRTRHFIAFLVHAVCGTPRNVAVAGGLPGHQTAGDKLLRHVP